MGALSNLYYFFTPYTDARERAVGIFFKKLTERNNRTHTRVKLNGLMQADLAAINLWSEYRYKGYKYLNKPQRKKLYKNLELITADFDAFYITFRPSSAREQTLLLQALMAYFSPNRDVYVYRESSSFGRLLRDPAHEKLIGDCNQIVTLYIYLFSRYFNVSDLQIRELPAHVALHYNGVDIEATKGMFANYSRSKGGQILPIEEIVSMNLLDTTDAYLDTHDVSAEDFLQASRFAYILSHQHTIAAHNLKVAYGKAVISLMKRNNYKSALKLARYSRNERLINTVGNNGAIYEIERKDYTSARKYAKYAPNGDALIRSSWQAEFFDEQSKLDKRLTSENIKNHTATIKRMRHFVKKAGNKKLIEYANKL